jgi:hypothetical protein
LGWYSTLRKKSTAEQNAAENGTEIHGSSLVWGGATILPQASQL